MVICLAAFCDGEERENQLTYFIEEGEWSVRTLNRHAHKSSAEPRAKMQRGNDGQPRCVHFAIRTYSITSDALNCRFCPGTPFCTQFVVPAFNIPSFPWFRTLISASHTELSSYTAITALPDEILVQI